MKKSSGTARNAIRPQVSCRAPEAEFGAPEVDPRPDGSDTDLVMDVSYYLGYRVGAKPIERLLVTKIEL